MRDFLRKNFGSGVAGAAAVGTIVAATSGLFFFSELRDASVEVALDATQARMAAELEREIAEIRSALSKVSETISDAADLPEGTAVALKFDSIETRLREIEERLHIVDVIEAAVTESPERAMSIPMLRKDIDILQEDVSDDVSAIRLEIERIYDLGKWFLGLVATMAVGILGLAVGNLLKGKGE